MFLTFVAYALSCGDERSRYSLHASAKYREYNEDLIFCFEYYTVTKDSSLLITIAENRISPLEAQLTWDESTVVLKGKFKKRQKEKPFVSRRFYNVDSAVIISSVYRLHNNEKLRE